MTSEAIILAGGLGTRLRSAIGDLPKPLAPVGGRPFLQLLLSSLSRAGIDRVVLSLGHGAQPIRERFATCTHPHLTFAIEETPLGTGGAIRDSQRQIRGDHAFVLNGDTFVNLDFTAMEIAFKAARTKLAVALKRVPDVSRYGAVLVESSRVTGFVEKGLCHEDGLINAGVYLASRDLFEGTALPDSFSFERDFLPTNLTRLDALGFITDGFFIDIGVPEDYARAQRELPTIMAAAEE